MQTNNTTPPTQDEDALTITLPANALDAPGVPLNSQLNGSHGSVESFSPFAAATARDGLFPCFKKSIWGDRIVIKIMRQHDAPGLA